MNEEEFKYLYPNLQPYILGFIEQAYEPISDDKIIEDYFEDKYIEYYKNEVLPQAHEVLQLEPFPKNAIENIAMIWFDTPEKTKSWFAEIVAKLEEKVSEADNK